MLPHPFTSDFYANGSQFVDQGYSAQFPPNPDPGPSASTSNSSSGNPRENDSTVVRRSVSRPKRKRGSTSVTDGNPDNSPESGSTSIPGSQRTVPKKKKANRACFHCQKAHLTCDDSRPCQRCIKRGLADNCTEGLRKKAKYLLDEEELAALKQQQQQKSRERTDPGNETPGPLPPTPHQPLNPPQAAPPDPHPDPLFNLAFNQDYAFGSEAANLEYSILSAILGNPSPPNENSNLNSSNADASGSLTGTYPQFANPDWPAPPPQIPPRTTSPTITPSFLQQQAGQQGQAYENASPYQPQPPQPQSFNHINPQYSHPSAGGSQNTDSSLHQSQNQMQYGSPWDANNLSPAGASTSVGPGMSYLRTNASGQTQDIPYQSSAEVQLQGVPPGHSQGQPPNQIQGLAPLSPPPSNSSPGTPLAGEAGFQFQLAAQGQPVPRIARPRNPQQHQTPSWGISGSSSTAADATDAARGYSGTSGDMTTGNGDVQEEGEASNVYNAVTRRYDYTQGYHFLMRHLHARFDKNDILRVVRALAIVRPSLIALQMPLTEEDEVFVEKCFQRSLIELEKLISFGGTPTVVWRRTGEICLVGFEFTMLTEWTREELLGRRKFIYELFENQSTVEYFEKFAAHAFENTTQSVISHSVLLKPDGAPVPCAFCFSIRRDIFDLPNMIIGQWLPLL